MWLKDLHLSHQDHNSFLQDVKDPHAVCQDIHDDLMDLHPVLQDLHLDLHNLLKSFTFLSMIIGLQQRLRSCSRVCWWVPEFKVEKKKSTYFSIIIGGAWSKSEQVFHHHHHCRRCRFPLLQNCSCHMRSFPTKAVIMVVVIVKWELCVPPCAAQLFV